MSELFTRELKRVLRDNACRFDRQGKGDHEIWFSPITNHYFVVDQGIRSRHTAQKFSLTGIGQDGGCYDPIGVHTPCSPEA